MSDLAELRQRLAVLGVEVSTDLPFRRPPHSWDGGEDPPSTSAQQPSRTTRASSVRGVPPQRILEQRGRSDVADLIDRCGRAAVALRSAESTTAAAQRRTAAQLERMAESRKRPQDRNTDRAQPRPAGVPRPPARGASPSISLQRQAPQPVAPLMPPPHPAPLVVEHMRAAVPSTPLSSVLHQYKEAETNWAHDKTQLRREAVSQRKRAARLEQDLQRLGRTLEHRTLDVAALKAALNTRDEQLHEAHNTARQREEALVLAQSEGAERVAALTHEREDLKALLLATLQKLEAVGEVVQRADVTSSVMEKKVAALEEERIHALEAAARARAEVQDLSENRRRLAWQSKLLEKMSEMQLQHNRQKTEAIKQLLDADGAAADDRDEFDRHGDDGGDDLAGDDLLGGGGGGVVAAGRASALRRAARL